MTPEIFPVIETKDLVYAHQYNWLKALAEVTSAVLIRPEPLVAKAFRMGVILREFLAREYGVRCREIHEIRIMMDHGIFVEDFENVMDISKTPENLVHVYDVLGIDYGLSYDVPAKLYLYYSVNDAISMLCNGRRASVPEKAIEKIIHGISDELLNHVSIRDAICSKDLMNVRKMLQEALRNGLDSKNSRIYELVYKLSEECARETCRRFEIQVRALNRCKRFEVLMPVVQGLFKEHIDECIECELNTLKNNGFRSVYMAIGTGGRILSRDDKLGINYAIGRAYNVAKRLGMNIKIHLLGWSAPRNARGIDYLKIYSVDSLTARRRSVEGRIYMLSPNCVPSLVHVSEIDIREYSCNCPACRVKELRRLVLDPSGARRNDVRIVHNIYVLKQYFELSLNS